MKKTTYKILVIIIIQIISALIHGFRLGQIFNGELYILYYSYFSDLIIPFAIYFLLCANEFSIAFLRDWRVKSIIVFSVATITEIGQYFGIHFLGVTFDAIDIIMFGAGVMLAAIFDKQVFSRIFRFWTIEYE
jgi:hypothetical protein